MTNPKDQAPMTPPEQTGESEGPIKRPQQTDRTMAERDLPRRSEAETHARK